MQFNFKYYYWYEQQQLDLGLFFFFLPKLSVFLMRNEVGMQLNMSVNMLIHMYTHTGYYMAVRGYEFYLRVVKVSLTRSLHSLVRDTFSTRR